MNQLPDFHTTSFTAIEREGEPWVTSSDLARALGYARADAISRIFERNESEFASNMTAILRIDQPATARARRQIDGVPPSTGHSDTRIFSLRGAHLVAMFARTPVAAEFRRWVLDVLDGLAAPALPAQDGVLRRWLTQFDIVSTEATAQYLTSGYARDQMKVAATLLRSVGWVQVWVRGPRADDFHQCATQFRRAPLSERGGK